MKLSNFTTQQLFDLNGFEHKALFKREDYVWSALNEISQYLENQVLGALQGEVSPQAYLINPKEISIGIGTVVEPGAYIEGPCILGNYCRIRSGAYIRGGVITGDHCVIGHTTEVKNSILLHHAQAAHFAYVGDSILGNHVNLGAGAKLSNLLFSKKNILIQTNEEPIDTQRRKLGAILGDYSQVGCNTVTNPGTILGKRACVYPCINIGGVVAEDFAVKGSSETISYPQKKYVFS